MNGSTKREVSHDPRSKRKLPGSQSRKTSTSTEAKLPEIIKASSSTVKTDLEKLYSPNQGCAKFIKFHGNSENSKSKSSSETSSWASPDLSPGIETLFNAMNLYDDFKVIDHLH
jgi:hypothetical protein